MDTQFIPFPIPPKFPDDGIAHYMGRLAIQIDGGAMRNGITLGFPQKTIENYGYGIGVFRTGNTYYGIRIKSLKQT